MPRALEELQHQHLHALADGAQSGAHGGGGLAFAGTGVDDDETAADVWHGSMSQVVGVALEDCKSSIELFEQNHAG